MATPLFLYLFNEAVSGTAPTALVDSAASPLNAPLAYGTGAAWTTNNGGDALNPGTAATNPATSGYLKTGVTKLRTALSGAKQISYEAQETITTLTSANDSISLVYCDTSGTVDVFGLDRLGPGSGNGYALATNTAADGDHESVMIAATVGYKVIQAIVDTSLASNRRKLFINGFLSAQDSNNVTQNTTFVFSGGAGTERLFGALSTPTGSYNQGFAAIYASALTAADCLAHALRLFATNDSDPNTAGAHLRQAGTNGGTNDGSTSTSDQTVAPTQTVAASGNNRGLFALVTGLTVTTGVTACTFNGVAGTKLTQQTSTASSDAEVWWWNDAALPSAAGTYSASITVDGVTGTACASLHYDEGVSQSAPTNFGLATGTGTSITATLASNATAGSILHGVLFDVTVGDTAVDAANQLPISTVNGTSTGNTHRQTTSAKYVPTAGANSMAWSGLTNATTKIAIAIEVLAAPIASSPATVYKSFQNPVASYGSSTVINVTPSAPPASPPTICKSLARYEDFIPYYASTQINPGAQYLTFTVVPPIKSVPLSPEFYGLSRQITVPASGSVLSNSSSTPQAATAFVGLETAVSSFTSTPQSALALIGATLASSGFGAAPQASVSFIGVEVAASALSSAPNASSSFVGAGLETSALAMAPQATPSIVGAETTNSILSIVPQADGAVSGSETASSNLSGSPQAVDSFIGAESDAASFSSSPIANASIVGSEIDATALVSAPQASSSIVGAETDATVFSSAPTALDNFESAGAAASILSSTPNADSTISGSENAAAGVSASPTATVLGVGAETDTAIFNSTPLSSTQLVGSETARTSLSSGPIANGSFDTSSGGGAALNSVPTAASNLAAAEKATAQISATPTLSSALTTAGGLTSDFASQPSALPSLVGAEIDTIQFVSAPNVDGNFGSGGSAQGQLLSGPVASLNSAGDATFACSFSSSASANFNGSTDAGFRSTMASMPSAVGSFSGPPHHPTARFTPVNAHSPKTSFVRIKP